MTAVLGGFPSGATTRAQTIALARYSLRPFILPPKVATTARTAPRAYWLFASVQKHVVRRRDQGKGEVLGRMAKRGTAFGIAAHDFSGVYEDFRGTVGHCQDLASALVPELASEFHTPIGDLAGRSPPNMRTDRSSLPSGTFIFRARHNAWNPTAPLETTALVWHSAHLLSQIVGASDDARRHLALLWRKKL